MRQLPGHGDGVLERLRRDDDCRIRIKGLRCSLRGAAKERILRIELGAHSGSLFPFSANAAGLAVQIGSQRLELLEALAVRINLKQLDVNSVALRVFLFGFEQNLFRLRVAPVSHVNIGLSDWINLVGIDAARTRLAEISLRRRMRGIDTLSAGATEN